LLVFDDVRGAASILELARLMIEQLDASATILTVADNQEEVESRRAALLARQRTAELAQAQLSVRIGRPAEQITAVQNESLYSMVLLAPRARKTSVESNSHQERRRLRQLNRLGPTVMRVLERSREPVLVVKEPRPRLKRMLICTAIGEPGKTDVRVGGRLARRLGASVTLLYVTREGANPGRLVHAHLEGGSATLRALDVPVESKILPARTPAKGILAASREGDFDLIVIGKHGPQSRSVFGRDDVMLQVLVGADRPVLVVPEDV
jgi:nucleotide-binding universal stress UspA family protein